MQEPTKTCNRCGNIKAIDLFARQHTTIDGRRTICKRCLAEQSRGYLLMKRFGLTVAEYEAILARQDGKCALCETENPRGRWNVLHVDHCHETGRVRGLLCHRCNTSLGYFGDNEAGIRRLLDYVTTDA